MHKTKVSSIPNGFPNISTQLASSFCRNITNEEVKSALFIMSPFKAPRPDGFHATFYQNMWDTVG